MESNNQKREISVYSSGDYAGIRADGFSAYYGYAHTNGQDGRKCDPECDSEDWCFVFHMEEKKIETSFNRLGIEGVVAKKDWEFVVRKPSKDVVIPFWKLGAKDMFDVKDCLIRGLAIVISEL